MKVRIRSCWVGLSCCLPLVTVTALFPALTASAIAAEKTLLLCQGNTRNTARVYRNNGALMMRLFDRKGGVIWFNSPAKSGSNPEVTYYTNIAGEQTIRIETNRNSPNQCSIQVGKQPLERGTLVQ